MTRYYTQALDTLPATLSPNVVAQAHQRIGAHVHRTPVVSSTRLNAQFFNGHEVFFKAEMLQKTGSFKVRGALNAVLHLAEQNALPQRIVTVSSGNHAQATAYAASKFNIPVTVFMAADSSPMKQAATKAYGAQVVICQSRAQAEQQVQQQVAQGAFYLPPFDHDDIIAGQGTACYEALQDIGAVDAVIMTCGGGGWGSGSWLATQLLCPSAVVLGAEPANADDAYQSFTSGVLTGLAQAPQTIADGAKTPILAARTFAYIKQFAAILPVAEADIAPWQNRLQQYLKLVTEPTSAVAAAGLQQWLATQSAPKRCLVLLSGGNVTPPDIM